MTLKLTRGLWLWAGALMLVLLILLPLAAWIRVFAMLAVVVVTVLAWRRAGRRVLREREAMPLAEGVTLPASTYRQPVVLVCGDGLKDLFGQVPLDQLALHLSEQGCYLRVASFDQLSRVIDNVLAHRPHWREQLSVLLVANPGEHTDSAAMSGRVRAFRHQLALARQRGLALPLLLASYVPSQAGESAWFSWESAMSSPCVYEAGARTGLTDWQRQTDSSTYARRLSSGIQLSAGAQWLAATVLPNFVSRVARDPACVAVACGITLVPALAHTVDASLWQQWLRERTALAEAAPRLREGPTSLPFPDPLLQLLPIQTGGAPVRRASVIALWLFSVAAVIALLNSAWQNTLLARQVSDDLRGYLAIAPSTHPGLPGVAQQQTALAVLRADAQRLGEYYRHGAPLSLGLGLYRGEQLREPLLAAIAGYRPPIDVPIPSSNAPGPVRLDSLALFDSGRATLKAGSTKVLINALVNIKAQPGWLIVIAGHTDASGSAEHNLQLSRARAGAVRDWMQRMGDIPDSCFAVQGFGASQPIDSNDTEQGRALNRRVDIRRVPEVGACALPTAALGRQHLPHSAAFNF
ncbi:OmpA family protein [Pseudomonas sp.]|uniref:OmpA family protein n=1 Tax=Pseudomonas sp. TaxID=306 RepID=UPI003D6F2BCA